MKKRKFGFMMDTLPDLFTTFHDVEALVAVKSALKVMLRHVEGVIYPPDNVHMRNSTQKSKSIYQAVDVTQRW